MLHVLDRHVTQIRIRILSNESDSRMEGHVRDYGSAKVVPDRKRRQLRLGVRV